MAAVMDSAFKDRRRQISEDSEDEYLNLSDGTAHPDDSYKSDSSAKSPQETKAPDPIRRPVYAPRRFISRRPRGVTRSVRGKRYIRKQVLSAAAADFSPDVQFNPSANDFVSTTQVPQPQGLDAAAEDFQPTQEWW